jgi:hypothetical protein
VAALAVGERFAVLGDFRGQRAARGPRAAVDKLLLERRAERLSDGVVVAVAIRAQRDGDAGVAAALAGAEADMLAACAAQRGSAERRSLAVLGPDRRQLLDRPHRRSALDRSARGRPSRRSPTPRRRDAGTCGRPGSRGLSPPRCAGRRSPDLGLPRALRRNSSGYGRRASARTPSFRARTAKAVRCPSHRGTPDACTQLAITRSGGGLHRRGNRGGAGAR